MIAIDKSNGSYQLASEPPIAELLRPCKDCIGLNCKACRGTGRCLISMDSADVFIIAKGPEDKPISIGIELASIEDLISKLHTKRFQGFQHPNMVDAYDVCYLLSYGRIRSKGTGIEYSIVPGKWKQFDAGGYSYTYKALVKILAGPALIDRFNYYNVESYQDAALWIRAVYDTWNKKWSSHESFCVTYQAPVTEARSSKGFSSLTPLIDLTTKRRNFLYHLASIPGVDFEIAYALSSVFNTTYDICRCDASQLSKIPLRERHGKRRMTIGPERAKSILYFLKGH